MGGIDIDPSVVGGFLPPGCFDHRGDHGRAQRRGEWCGDGVKHTGLIPGERGPPEIFGPEMGTSDLKWR